MGNKQQRKTSKVSKAGWRSSKKKKRHNLEKARAAYRRKRLLSNNAENDGNNISDNDAVSGDNINAMSDNDTVNYNVDIRGDDDLGMNMSDNDAISDDNMNINVSDNDTVNHNVGPNLHLNVSDSDTVNYNIDINIIDSDTMNQNVGAVDVNMSDLSDAGTGNISTDSDDASEGGHLVITDEGPRTSKPRKRKGSTKGPSRKLPKEPRRPRRSDWLNVVSQSRRSSARLRRLDESAGPTPGSSAYCDATSADLPQQTHVPDEPIADDDLAGSQVTRSSVNSRSIRNDMVRITQENTNCVLSARTRSQEQPPPEINATANENVNYEELDSMLARKPKPTPGKNPYYYVLCNNEKWLRKPCGIWP